MHQDPVRGFAKRCTTRIYIDINRTTGFIQRDACHTQVDTVIFSEQIDMNCAIYILLFVWTELIQVSDACFLGALTRTQGHTATEKSASTLFLNTSLDTVIYAEQNDIIYAIGLAFFSVVDRGWSSSRPDICK